MAMICTFGDLTDVIWWRELSLPVRAILQPNGALRRWRGAAPAGNRATRRGAGRLRSAGVAVGRQGAREDRRAAARSAAICSASRGRSRTPVKFYEKGDRPLEIITSRQWFIRTLPFRERLLERGRELQWHPRVHAGPLRELGRRPERRLVRQPAALLRRAVPGLVSPRRGRQRRLRVAARCPTKRSCRWIRRPTCRPATPRRSAASRTASSAIPTSWTPGRRRR